MAEPNDAGLEFVRMEDWHLEAILKAYPSNEMPPIGIKYAETAFRGDKPIYCGGLSEVAPRRMVGWGVRADVRPRELAAIVRQMRWRIDDAVLLGNFVTVAAGPNHTAWPKRLGFKNIQTVKVGVRWLKD